jgi:transposase
MSQKRIYKQYPQEFKEEAVALVTEQGYSVPEAAKSLGIATNLLYRWKEKQEQSASESRPSETELGATWTPTLVQGYMGLHRHPL